MPSKTLIAVLAVLAGVLAAAPASAQAAPVCPPGVTDANYCAVNNESGLTTKDHSDNSSNNKTVNVNLHCGAQPGCTGTLYLESSGGKSSSMAHSSATVIYGSAHYSLTFGQTASVTVHLTAAGQSAIGKTGTLSTTVVSVSNNVRSVIGHLTVKGHKATKKKSKHTTHATTKPGFTG